MATFEVRVVNDDDEGIEGVGVGLEFTSLVRGMVHEETDSEGIAYFDGYDEGEINIYIDGHSYGTFYYEDGEQVTITK